MVIAAHLGHGTVTMDEFLGHAIEPMGGTFYGREELEQALEDRAFGVEEARERDPLPHEYPSRRIYLIARRGQG